MIASALPGLFTGTELMEMDSRVLMYWDRVADRARRTAIKEMAYAVRVGFNADGNTFAKVMHELTDERSAEEKAQDEWEELKFIGGG